jgi:beta-lactamase superfamily II metal-dependent hydrolase
MFSTTLDLIMKIRTLFILLILLLGFVPTNAEPAPQIMTVAFLDVGQGDATLIRDGNGFDVLVDGGKKGASDGFIESNEIPVESVYYNGYPGTTQTWIEFTDAVNTAGLSLIEANYPDTFTWGGINVQVLNPVEGLIDPDQNKASVVLHIDYANSSVFLPADIDTSIENQLSTRAATLAADILKIAHHGSKNSTSEAFLSAVMPQEAIISVGPNGYGHPAIETISRLDANDVGIWRTDAIGTIFLSTDGESIEMLPKLVFIPNAMNSFKHEEDQ